MCVCMCLYVSLPMGVWCRGGPVVERPTVDQQAQSRVLTPPPHTMFIMADLGEGEWGGDERQLCQVKVMEGGMDGYPMYEGRYEGLNGAPPLVCRCAWGAWSVSLLTCPKGASGTVWRVRVEVSAACAWRVLRCVCGHTG